MREIIGQNRYLHCTLYKLYTKYLKKNFIRENLKENILYIHRYMAGLLRKCGKKVEIMSSHMI